MRSMFDENGYALVERVFNAGQCEAIADRVSTASVVRAGSRNLLHDAWCSELAQSLKGHAAIAAHLPVAAVGVQCTLFDKSPVKNWLVALHQDLSIPVRQRITDPACTGWSEKEGVLFVQPPLPASNRWSRFGCISMSAAPGPAHCAWCLALTGMGGSPRAKPGISDRRTAR